MAKYRIKPSNVEAFKYDGDLMNSKGNYYVPDWAVEAFKKGIIYYNSLIPGEPPCELFIGSSEYVSIGDYVVQDSDGEIYSCEPDAFEEAYEKVED